MGFLYQKLHRPRSYDYLKKSEKYKTWDDRLRMPQFAWANDPAAVEEVMTFVLGLTGETDQRQVPAQDALPRPRRRAGAEGAKVLNRHNCTGCHVLEMPKFDDPARASRSPRRSPTSRRNLRTSYNSRATDYLAELYPGLTYDPKKKLDADAIETRAGARPTTTARRSPSRGCRSACSRTS